jgi:hypothetical protein
MQSDSLLIQQDQVLLVEKNLGWALGAHGAYALSDMFDLELELFGTRNGSSLDKSTDVLAATAGVAYKIDILRWIPYVGALGGYYHWGGAPGPHGQSGGAAGGSLQVGLDFLLTREVALGVDFRVHFSFEEEFHTPFQTLMLGAEYRWDF